MLYMLCCVTQIVHSVDFRTASSDDDDDNHSNENTIHMSEMKNKPQQSI